MSRTMIQKLLHPILQNCAKPKGRTGKLIVSIMNATHAPLSKWGLSHINPPPNAEAIELGCGGGINVSALLAMCPEGRVTGLDYSPVSVAASGKKNAVAILEGRCRIVEGNVADLPFPDESFDIATAFETVYFWPDGSFSEVHRILKPGGEFLIVCEADGSCPSDKTWPRIIDGMKLVSQANLVHSLEQAGFREISTDRKSVMGDAGRWLCALAKK